MKRILVCFLAIGVFFSLISPLSAEMKVGAICEVAKKRQNFERVLGIKCEIVSSSILLNKEKRDSYDILIGKTILTEEEYDGLRQYISDGGVCIFHSRFGFPVYQQFDDGTKKYQASWMKELVGAASSRGSRWTKKIKVLEENPITEGLVSIGEKVIEFDKLSTINHVRLYKVGEEVIISADVILFKKEPDGVLPDCPYVVMKRNNKGACIWVTGHPSMKNDYQKKILKNLYREETVKWLKGEQQGNGGLI